MANYIELPFLKKIIPHTFIAFGPNKYKKLSLSSIRCIFACFHFGSE